MVNVLLIFLWLIALTVRVTLLVTIGSVHIVGGSLMFGASFQVVLGKSHEGVTRGGPLFGHLEEISRSCVHLQSLILLGRATAQDIMRESY